MEFETQLVTGLTAALGLGILIGMERERRHGRRGVPRTAAGIRTHALLALFGAIATELGLVMLACGAVGTIALTTASYLRFGRRDPGLTGEFAILLTYFLGALALREPLLASALGVLVAVLLALKEWLHRVTRELVSEREMRDLLLLMAALLIVLPLLPDEPVDPWQVLVPSALGKLVVLVMAVGAAGHVATRLIGARWGLPVAGFFAGFASSTAATGGFGQRARATPALCTSAASAALFANLASLVLFAIVIGAAAPALLLSVRWPLLAGGALLAACAAIGLYHASHDENELPARPHARAFKLSHALLFAAAVAVVLLLSAWLHQLFGDRGALVAATLAAIAELHAAAAGLAQLSASNGIGPGHARWGVLALLAASVAGKSVLAFASGGASYGIRVAVGLLGMLAAAVLTLWLLPAPAPTG